MATRFDVGSVERHQVARPGGLDRVDRVLRPGPVQTRRSTEASGVGASSEWVIGQYGAGMSKRLAVARRQFRSTLTTQQQRGVRVLAWLSVISLVGVSLTGVWQFFSHDSNPAWYSYVAGSGGRGNAAPSEGTAELHSQFAATVGVIALIGGAWFAYRVLYDVPWPAVWALLLALIGLVSGSVIRFNIVKLRDREYEEAGRGYAQLFGGDLEFVVTDRFELGPAAIRLWTIGHVATVPIMLILIWLGIGRTDEGECSGRSRR